MFGTTLDVAIGLVLVYVLFAILVSSITEVISASLQLRAKALENAFARLLEDPPPAANKAKDGTVIVQGLAMFGGHKRLADPQGKKSLAGTTAPLAAQTDLSALDTTPQAATTAAPASVALSYTAVFNHPLIAGTQTKNRPAYVSSENFTSALLFALRGLATGTIFSDFEKQVDALAPGSLKSVLTTLVREAEGDLAALKAGIARWYDSSMDRLSGEYKRFAQVIAFGVGLVLAVACNVDTVQMVQRLYAEPALRASLDNAAQHYVDSKPAAAAKAPSTATPGADKASPPAAAAGVVGTPSAETVDDVKAKFQKAQEAQGELMKTAPVGWTSPPQWWAPPWKWTSPWEMVLLLIVTLAGWLVTALAGMLGAPFWFDLLQKLVNVRGTGPKPSSTTA
jgi:hypothetical protein